MGGQRVSGPGALSRRTDLDSRQPIRLPTGGGYGDRAALDAQQRGAPVPEGGPLGEAASAQVSPGGPPMDPLGVIGSVGTQRPDEDIMSGAGIIDATAAPIAPSAVIEAMEYLIDALDPPSQALVDTYLALRGEQLG